MVSDLEILQRLERIEEVLHVMLKKQTVRDWYSTEEAAEILGLSEFTVRNYCRLGRIRAEKRRSGRGKFCSWVISHDELERVRREGLLPLRQRMPL